MHWYFSVLHALLNAKSHDTPLYNIHAELVTALFLVAVIVPSIILISLNGEHIALDMV